ncbi:PREDICTED: DNA (cytosine-5)-methyltransferase 3-like [Capra hircus]|uniref:DNA (cytosine-5)-methyltransferase 3-like n=1 Tax=Capra hircus TaxID=9925 RepID=UPI000846DCB8|nr:PREDICTED: DNA (cytosine-5)-methyltransferase 3-like [Capra hircus]
MALSSPGTLNLETVDGSDPDPALLPDREQWPPPCEILLDPEAEHSLDIILVGSSELSSPPSPGPRRDFIAYEVKVNQRDIEGGDVCSVQGKQGGEGGFVAASGQCGQPGFALTKDKFLECLFLYDDDGYQSYCSICCAGETLLICENPDCTRCYCFECVDTLVGPGTSGKVHAMSYWVCFLCLPFPRSGLLQRRRKWRTWLKAFYDREAENPLEMYKTVPVWKREPIRVLSLFGDIKKELTSLGFLEDGSKPGRLKHLDDVTNVVRRDIDEWGPFDLTYGSTPALGHTCDHPPGWYVYQFHRILQYARPLPGSPQPFFWMFVDNLVLTEEDLDVATRFLETDPVTIQDVRGRTVQNAVRVWSNIPAVKSRHSALVSQEELSLLAQDRQRVKPLAQGPATLVKNCFLPLREYFKYFSTELTSSL